MLGCEPIYITPMVKRNIDKTMNPPPNIWTFLLYDGRTFVFFELKAEKIKPSKTIPIVVIVFAKLKNKTVINRINPRKKYRKVFFRI